MDEQNDVTEKNKDKDKGMSKAWSFWLASGSDIARHVKKFEAEPGGTETAQSQASPTSGQATTPLRDGPTTAPLTSGPPTKPLGYATTTADAADAASAKTRPPGKPPKASELQVVMVRLAKAVTALDEIYEEKAHYLSHTTCAYEAKKVETYFQEKIDTAEAEYARLNGRYGQLMDALDEPEEAAQDRDKIAARLIALSEATDEKKGD